MYQKEDNLHCMQYIAHVEETFFNVKEATRFIWTIIQMGKGGYFDVKIKCIIHAHSYIMFCF